MIVPRQPELNIGMVGHVDHGKTTLTYALTGEWTDKHSEEIRRGVSIRMGYADTAFYKCSKCGEPECYSIDKKCRICRAETEIQRCVSFVDAPGHETLMATMLSGTSIMNGALLLIAANETCPQPQTKEHLMGLEICGIKNILIVQNKIDVVSEEQAMKNHEEILNFVNGSIAEGKPVIPVSAHHDANIDMLIKKIIEDVPLPKLDDNKPPRMYVARSFDINTPGRKCEDLVGGVIGGSLLQGIIKIGDEIEISPGRKIDEKKWESIFTKVVSLVSGGKHYKRVKTGGLIAIGTSLDPTLTKSDAIAGSVVGYPGTLPPLMNHILMEIHLLERVVGVYEDLRVEEIRAREPLMLTVGTATTVGIVTSARNDLCDLSLKLPVCAGKGQHTAISRRIGGRWRLIGYGIIK